MAPRYPFAAFIALVPALLLFFGARDLHATEVEYADVDRAVVRVIAGAAIDFVTSRVDGREYHFATPASGHGSGFVVSTDGLIVTAAHVVQGARAVAVEVPGMHGARPARVIAIDKARDFAVLYVRGEYKSVVQLAPSENKLRVRQPVFAIGYPLDARRVDPQSSRGIVSGALQNGTLQLDVAVNPGNSGGPAVDESNVVQGIVVARGAVEKGIIGMTFAVPTSTFRPMVDALLADKKYLATFDPITQPEAQKLVELVELLSGEGGALLRGSVDPTSQEGMKMAKRVLDLIKGNERSSDFLLLGSAFFWNRHLVRWMRNEDYTTPRSNAIDFARRAVALAPELRQECKFVKILLRDDP
jgi:S1-C subfamily serine protease